MVGPVTMEYSPTIILQDSEGRGTGNGGPTGADEADEELVFNQVCDKTIRVNAARH